MIICDRCGVEMTDSWETPNLVRTGGNCLLCGDDLCANCAKFDDEGICAECTHHEKEECEFCTSDNACFYGGEISETETIDLKVYDKSIEMTIITNGKTAEDYYIPISFCPLCGKELKKGGAE